MDENLATTRFNHGTGIPLVTDSAVWIYLATPAYCWYNNDQATYGNSYGAIYNWYASDTTFKRDLCPTGWHVPMNDEWTALTDFIGETGFPHGNELKSCRQVNSPLGGDCNTSDHPRWNEHSTHYGTDDYGFSGLPGGYRWTDGYFTFLSVIGQFWSSSEATVPTAWHRWLHWLTAQVLRDTDVKTVGGSVRCLRDYERTEADSECKGTLYY